MKGLKSKTILYQLHSEVGCKESLNRHVPSLTHVVRCNFSDIFQKRMSCRNTMNDKTLFIFV